MQIHTEQSVILGAAFRIATNKTIYAWFRGDQALYIGAAKSGFHRLAKHPIIGVVEPLQDTDEIIVIPFTGEPWEMFNAERDLIIKYQPKYNAAHVEPKKNLVYCMICDVPFIQIRATQICCGNICRKRMTPEQRLLARIKSQSNKATFKISAKERSFIDSFT